MIDIDNLPSVIGLTVDEAREILASHGIGSVRVMTRDGQPCMGTDDIRGDRLNVSTNNGIITSVGNIG